MVVWLDACDALLLTARSTTCAVGHSLATFYTAMTLVSDSVSHFTDIIVALRHLW